MDWKLAAYPLIVASPVAGAGFQLFDFRKAWAGKDRGNRVGLGLGVMLFAGALMVWVLRWPE
jgi:hypothetical protein